MAAPTYNIPGQTSAAADIGEPPPRTVAEVLARSHAGDVLDELDHDLDRSRLRQASRLFADRNRKFTPADLTTLAESDIRASRVFALAAQPPPGQPGRKE